ncbi:MULTISPECIES: ribonuclease domain-containing protein [Streptomyces]|uniref:Ribonuclease domain-containing protein n=1 Tax=Streptomyces edwardsiae TaxID=3075527 RepID=A0ABU2PXK4_9ACTN|nr:ribonuclease domain-containing protein [Streptomyces sp. DSM 41636]MDT0396906.1 ribonuclease domain-containing protein [Streptomyces sp. DSM 41636]
MVLRQALLLRLLACLLVLLAGCSSAGGDGATPSWADGMGTVQEADLPAEARRTLELVDTGGPFPYERDGAVFGNFEGLLPQRERGYYHEYTVRTPGSADRGARRVVTGRGGETYYTDDHYASFTAVLR